MFDIQRIQLLLNRIEDAIELILAGATMVSVGTANFTNPNVTLDIIDGIEDYMKRKNIKEVKSLIGAIK